jgi:Tol biopolymer transport system component/plastocyanin
MVNTSSKHAGIDTWLRRGPHQRTCARVAILLSIVALVAMTMRPAATASQAVHPVGPNDLNQGSTDVLIKDFYFDPGMVNIPVGGIIRWTNVGSTVHSTTSDDGLWDWTLLPGSSFMARFLSPGTYTYHCRYHPDMYGVIFVGPVMPTHTPPVQPTPGTPPPPGATAIVYDNAVSGDVADLYTILPDATQQQQLTNTPNQSEHQARWSPNRQQIAFAAGQAPALFAWRIQVLDVGSGQMRAITNGPQDYEPTWSPDGSWIAYTEVLQRDSAVVGSAIAVVRPDSTGYHRVVVLYSTTSAIGSPDWSPDGSQIAFVVRSNSAGGDIYVVDVGGTRAHVLLSHPGWDDIDPQWSPDGRYMAFASGPGNGPVEGIDHSLWITELATGITGTIARAPDWDLRRPAWSPDGTQLVFNAKYRNGGLALYIVPALGGTVEGPIATGNEPDWTGASLLPVVTPTPPPGTPTIPPFPTFPPPGPTATQGAPPTFPAPTETPTATPTVTETPAATPTATETATQLPPSPTPTEVRRLILLPWAAKAYLMGTSSH